MPKSEGHVGLRKPSSVGFPVGFPVPSGSQCPVEVRGVAIPRIQDLSRATGLLVALRQGGLTQAP